MAERLPPYLKSSRNLKLLWGQTSALSFLPIRFRSYDYQVDLQRAPGSTLPPHPNIPPARITSSSIETETKLRWFIIRPSMYHYAFFHATSPANLQIPTQVTGGVAEAITLRVFEIAFNANNIEPISEKPRSKTADFAMDIQWSGLFIHVLVESKGSNAPAGGSWRQLHGARRQLLNTEEDRPEHIDAKFASLVSFRRRRIALVEVI